MLAHPRPADTASQRSGSGWEEPAGPPPPASLAPLLGSLGKAGAGWADRVAAFRALQDLLGALQQAGAGSALAAEVASNTDRAVAALLEGAGDAHFRVAAAALGALHEGLQGPCSRLFEPQLDRIMPALFARCAGEAWLAGRAR